MLDFSSYQRFKSFNQKPILAIDFGFKVIGTALFCPGRDPYPYVLEKIIYKSHVDTIDKLKKIIDEESIKVIVLGIPYFIDGKESQTTKSIKEFGKLIESTLDGIEFYEQDETLTTKAAQERMLNSAQYNFKIDVTKIDCVAATIILEDFIRS